MELCEHWNSYPPVNEMLHMLAEAYTDWRRPGRGGEKETLKFVHEAGGQIQPIEALPPWVQVSMKDYFENKDKVN